MAEFRSVTHLAPLFSIVNRNSISEGQFFLEGVGVGWGGLKPRVKRDKKLVHKFLILI